jgi:hypothetical protein
MSCALKKYTKHKVGMQQIVDKYDFDVK